MPLRLVYRAAAGEPVELDGILPSMLRGLPLAQIERLPVWVGNRQMPLGELFVATGEADDQLVIEGDLRCVDGIGRNLAQGSMQVLGAAGHHLGAAMTGGEIRVEGSVGDWAGAEMRGGHIQIAGSAGDYLGGAYHGSTSGMAGGTILVGGHAGDQTARTMRRGLIAVGGHVGTLAALDMVAGSLLVFGDCGARPAAGMRRGTLAVFGRAPELLPSFRPGSMGQFQFLQLYLRHLQKLGAAAASELLGAQFRIHHGDMLNGGRGEVLLRA